MKKEDQPDKPENAAPAAQDGKTPAPAADPAKNEPQGTRTEPPAEKENEAKPESGGKPAEPAKPAEPKPEAKPDFEAALDAKLDGFFSRIETLLAALKPAPAQEKPAAPADPDYKRTHESGAEPPAAPDYLKDPGAKDAERARLVAEYQAANAADFDAAWNAVRLAKPELFT